MLLKDKLIEDMKDAMRGKDALRLSTIRMLRSSIKNKEIALKEEIDDNGVIALVASAVKQRKDSIDQYIKAGRNELADKEKREIKILKEYMPAQASKEELIKRSKEVVLEEVATSIKDLGRVMKIVLGEFGGKADGRMINEIVREILSSQS